MGKLTYILLCTTAALLPATAKPAAKTPALPDPVDPAVSSLPSGNGPTPSRYAGEDLKTYIAELANQLAIRSRVSDPFAQLQDPNAKPQVKPTVAKTARRTAPEPPATLSDIVGRIEITTIMPKDRRFLVGSRSIGQGDKVPIAFRNKQIRTEVTEVSSHRIAFRNLDTGEIGVRQLNILPPGMTPGTRTLTAPGMVPTNPNAPLEIDLSTPLPTAIIPPAATTSP